MLKRFYFAKISGLQKVCLVLLTGLAHLGRDAEVGFTPTRLYPTEMIVDESALYCSRALNKSAHFAEESSNYTHPQHLGFTS